jgi:phage terminase large subunit
LGAKRSDLTAEQQTLALIKADPIAFVTYVLGVDHIEEWQREFLFAVRDNPRVAVRSGHGVGKTAVLAWVCLWLLLFTPEVKIPITAPSASQIEAGIWSEIGSWLRKLERRWPALAQQLIKTSDRISRVDAPDDAFCIVRTAAKERPEALAGIHSPCAVFIVDEASGVDDSVYDAARGSMSTPGAKTILAGNPTRPRGYFYDAFNANASIWYRLHVPCHQSSRVSPEFIAQIAAEFGQESNEYRIRVLGEFPLAEEAGLIPRPLIESAVGRNDIDACDAPVIWGVDPARFGSDRTTLAKRQGNRLLEHVTSWSGKDNMQVVGLILHEIECTPKLLRPAEIVVDSNGFGAGVADRLRELGYQVSAVNTGERPQIDTTRFARLRDELWWRCREWFGSRAVTMPNDEELIFELSCPTYEYDSSERIKVESKEKVKARLRSKKSPDKADAFVLTHFVQSTGPMFNESINQHVDTSWVV